MMTHLIAGLVGAAAAAVAWLLLGVMLPMAVRVLLSPPGEPVAAVFGGGSIAVAAIVGFGAGVYWRARRSRHRRKV